MKTETGSFNTSEISSLLNQNNIVYSNGNSEIWYVLLIFDSSTCSLNNLVPIESSWFTYRKVLKSRGKERQKLELSL